MRKGQIVEVLIEDTVFPSTGIGTIDGKKIEIKNAVLGQKVAVRITRNRKDKMEGKLLKVVEQPIESIDAVCPHFEFCGGCSHQHIPYDLQLKWKEREVLKLLDAKKIEGYTYDGIVKSPSEFGYRNKMEFTFGNEEKGGEITLGMHQPGKFHNITQISDCRIVDDDYNAIVNTISQYCRKKGLSFFSKVNHEGYLRHLVIRKSFKRNELLINIVTTTQIEHNFENLIEKLKSLSLNSNIVGFLHTFNDSVGDAITNQGCKVLYGRDYVIEEILGLQFKISAFSFFQTNSLGAEKLYGAVQEYLSDASGKTVYDLYCGTGTITQIVAQKAKMVYGIELVEEAIDSAIDNARLNNIENIRFIAGDVGEKLKEIEEKPDIIIVDPPRAGIGPKALKQIVDYGVKEIIYVSCNPKTLVDNLSDMIEAGYKLERVKLVDMFPHTRHCEVVVKIEHV
ncbi:23S rRNA (uracil-C(5))-methyltransferase RlmCD [Oxobacter pfennigii]|uniref:23S rRNA (Uracil-C(5))-methyltransferase RlmCD n=1 Tax=Oxobacter pfennigii TaxID=36849 RepID=A0A0N8NT10_9CLOT|nr:23S rRNA (uracil(1939)-C(5))-methyltransferase RlmD [Oxobacter pfennigii]KPU43528.1 23S rRNA (uracil-C(5))-methyltransferase RlmCD [Oxobacter pfennigii]